MKTLLLAFALISATALADTIHLNQYSNNSIPVNGLTGLITYCPTCPSISGSGNTYYGGSVIFDASGFTKYGRFAGGSLNIQSSMLVVSGSLSNVFFNPKTGLLQGQFSGTIWYNGAYIQTCRQHTCWNVAGGTFYESIDLKNHTMSGGRLVYSTAPEPNSLLLLATGLACTVLYRRRFRIT